MLRALIGRARMEYMRRTGRVVIEGIGKSSLPKRALLHYKLDPLVDSSLQRKYHHTNGWEVPELVRILNAAGFRVDVVDRSNRAWMPVDRYDVLISNASGNSGRMYPTYAERTPSARHIFYALGPEVSDANARVAERYRYLQERTNVATPTMRIMESVDIARCMAVSDGIACLDDNGYSTGTYRQFGLPICRIQPSASPRVVFEPASVKQRDRRKFLAFTGDGFIAKGVDLLVEAFLDMPDMSLTIAGPDSDRAFWDIYGAKIRSSNNIKYEGFLQVGGPHFRRLMTECAWVILPTSAEGLCTSITTCMRAGLVPIAPYESGVEVGDFGVRLTSDVRAVVPNIRETAKSLAGETGEAYERRVDATVRKAGDYSQAAFTRSWTAALEHLLQQPRRERTSPPTAASSRKTG